MLDKGDRRLQYYSLQYALLATHVRVGQLNRLLLPCHTTRRPTTQPRQYVVRQQSCTTHAYPTEQQQGGPAKRIPCRSRGKDFTPRLTGQLKHRLPAPSRDSNPAPCPSLALSKPCAPRPAAGSTAKYVHATNRHRKKGV